MEGEIQSPYVNNDNTPHLYPVAAMESGDGLPVEIQSPDGINDNTHRARKNELQLYPVSALESGKCLPMEIQSPDFNTDNTPGAKKNELHLYPVAALESGEGLPYAPEDWPNPGDKWIWRVGHRTTVSGHFVDRYLYLPSGLMKKSKKISFKSKLSVEQYIRSAFPGADLNAFFASFSWQIPSKHLYKKKDDKEGVTPSGDTELSGTDSQLGAVTCRAGNQSCSSLVEAGNIPSEFMSCDICCSEPGFCQHCSCILCCGTICSPHDDYSYIRCEARVDGGYICGHVAHIDCGLRAYLAGTVGDTVGLDAEYYCRRCDSRTDLILHVTKLIKTCKSTDSRDDIQKILTAGIRLLHGSQKASAEVLVHQMKFAMAKLKKETQPEDISGKEDVSSIIKGQPLPLDSRTRLLPRPISSKFDPRVEALKLEDEIDQVLLKLRKSQEYEYRLVKERLFAQKGYVQTLYDQLDKERLARRGSSIDAVLVKLEKLKQEFIKLMNMKQVEKGFGRAPKHVLKEYFGSDIELL